MNMRYDIMTKQMLITLEKQLIYFLGKKTFRNLNINDMSFLFNKIVNSIFIIIIFKNKLLLIIEILS